MTSGETQNVAADAKSLGRGMLVNLAGAVPKLLYPALLVLVVRHYGKEIFGIYSLVESTLFFAMYVALFGLDKGVLWWIPRQPPGEDRRGLKSVLFVVGAASLVGTGLLAALAPYIAPTSAEGVSYSHHLRIMCLALFPMAWMQLFVHTALAKRKVATQVILREGIASLLLVGAALVFWRLGMRRSGMAYAFLVANIAGLLMTALAFRSYYRGSRWLTEPLAPPRALVSFAFPMWLTGLVASLMLRLDLYLLAVLTDAATLGVYAAILQLGKAVRTAHVSFGQLVIALSSEISAEGDLRHNQDRLRAGFSHATTLMLAVLAPIVAFIALFAGWILSLFGEGFSAGAIPATILCVCWGVEGVLGLHGQVLIGLGKSRTTLLNIIATLIIESILLVLLIPWLGLSGAALSVGLASLAQNGFQMVEVRAAVGGWLYDAKVRRVAGHLAVASGLACLAYGIGYRHHDLGARAVALGLFLPIHLRGVLPLLRARKHQRVITLGPLSEGREAPSR